MNKQHILLQMIMRVAEALGPQLRTEMAFVGGVTTSLLLTDTFTREQVRSTDDVDLIVHVMGTAGFHALQNQLVERGFRNTMPQSGEPLPICAMTLDALRVDFMPDDEAILGFTNRWYREALDSAQPYPLCDELEIRLVTPPYFVATKLEAWKGRGRGDALASRDIEDLLALADGREELIQEMKVAPLPLQEYVAGELQALLADDYFQMALQSQSQGDPARADRLYIRLQQLAGIRPS